MTKRKITVAVTGLNNIDSPGPGIPVIRGLRDSKEFDFRIIGLSYETMEPGIYMNDHVDKSYQIPLPSAGIEPLLERLRYINYKENIDVVIPNFDAELYNFIKLSSILKEELGISSLLPDIDLFESRHKSKLCEFGEKYDILVPKSKMIFSVNELIDNEEEFEYPMVVKGQYYDASIAATREQAISYFHKISNKWGLPIILQQFVSGTEVNVTALGDGKGNCIGAVPMRKMYITDKGKAWAGITLDDKKLLEISKKAVENLKWAGGCELEYIKSKEGKYYLLEMNPRFPAWVYLANGAGQNHPEAMIKIALGEDVPCFENYEVGKLFIRYSYDLIVDISEFEKIAILGEK